MIKRRLQKSIEFFKLFSYTDIVKPEIKKFAFPYGPDDERIIQYFSDGEAIHLRMKLPIYPDPRSNSDWDWFEQELVIPVKIKEKITLAVSEQPLKPTLRTNKLKGSIDYFFLQFPWEYSMTTKKEEKGRTLAVDLGLKKIGTVVIFEDGIQISQPITIQLKGSEYSHIERLYNHIGNIQRQLSKEKKRKESNQRGIVRKEEERSKLYAFRNRLGEELAHTTTNIFIKIAQKWQCTKILIEDLRSYKPPKGRRSWSRKLSYWLRGKIAFLLEYKSKEKGITLQKICPWNTSSHCPRCTAKGLKVKGPNNLEENKCGRFFHCPECGFTADRDYIAALNIYRASFIDHQEIKSLKDTRPVPYMDSGILRPTVLGEGSEMNCNNLLVLVTGYEQ